MFWKTFLVCKKVKCLKINDVKIFLENFLFFDVFKMEIFYACCENHNNPQKPHFLAVNLLHFSPCRPTIF